MVNIFAKEELSFQCSFFFPFTVSIVWIINIVYQLTWNLFLLMDGVLQQQIIKNRAANYTDKKFISSYQCFDLLPLWLQTQVPISVLTFLAGYRFHLSPVKKKKIYL